MSWVTVTLGECCQIVSGATPKSNIQEYWGGDVWWATPRDLSELGDTCRYISSTVRTITEAGLRSCPATVLPVGSVLLSSRAPIGHVAINTVPMATNQGFKSLVPNTEQLSAEFLYHWLRHKRRYLESLGNGATFKEVSKLVVANIEIPLPPLVEQNKIATLLNQVDTLRVKRRESVTHFDKIAQSIFIDMFGDPALNTNRWDRMTIGSLAVKYSDGPFGSNLKTSHYTQQGIRVVRLQNIGVGEFIDDKVAYISEEHFFELKRHGCSPGDVLIATLGDPNLRACIQPSYVSIALNKADCVQFRPNHQLVTSQYVCTLLNLRSLERMTQNRILGQTRSRISMGRLRSLEVPVPPVELQEEFARRMEAVERLKEKQRAHLAELDALFESLQYRAFRGEL